MNKSLIIIKNTNPFNHYQHFYSTMLQLIFIYFLCFSVYHLLNTEKLQDIVENNLVLKDVLLSSIHCGYIILNHYISIYNNQEFKFIPRNREFNQSLFHRSYENNCIIKL